MLVNTFPRELMDLIVGDMDGATLAVCTLLSRHWRISALPVLCQDVTAYLADEDSGHPFFSFLASDASYNIAPCIKRLNLMGLGSGEMRGDLSAQRLDRVLSKLPNLETLYLSALFFCGSSTRALLECWQHPKMMKRVAIRDVLFLSPNEPDSPTFEHETTIIPPSTFVQLLNMFAVVRRLDITDVVFQEIDQLDVFADQICWNMEHVLEVAASVSSTFNVKELNSKSSGVHSHAELLQILWLSHSLCDLREVEFSPEVDLVSRALFQAAGQRLTRLHITPQNQIWSRYQSGQDRFGLSQCTMLSSLQYTVNFPGDCGPDNIVFASNDLKDVVLHVPTTLSQLRIHFTYYGVNRSDRLSSVEGMPWGTIDAHLSTLAISNVTVDLRHLDYGTARELLFPQASALVKKRLPRLLALKVLVVC